MQSENRSKLVGQDSFAVVQSQRVYSSTFLTSE